MSFRGWIILRKGEQHGIPALVLTLHITRYFVLKLVKVEKIG